MWHLLTSVVTFTVGDIHIMALKLKCRCGKVLSVPESAIGKKGKCPNCGVSFVIPGRKPAVHGPPAEESKPEPEDHLAGFSDLSSDLDDLLDEPFPAASDTGISAAPAPSPSEVPKAKKRSSTRQQMGKLANGIKLVFWGTLLTVGAIPIAFILGIIGGVSLAVIPSGMIIVGSLLATFGRITCLAAPSKAGGKPFLVIAVLCDLASGGISLIGLFAEEPSPIAEAISSLLSFGTMILFLLFLRAVAKSVGEERLAEDVVAVIVYILLTIVLIIMTPISLFIFPLLPLITAIGFMACGLISLVKYLNLLQLMAETVRP